MAEMPSYFIDPWDEIATISRYRREREQIKASVGDMWVPDSNGMTGYERLNRIAQVAPGLGSAALPMAQAGVDPDTDPIVQYAAQQAAMMDLGWAAGWYNSRMVRPGAGSSTQVQKYRMRNAVDAAVAAGLVDKDGQMHHPGSGDPHKLYIFGELRGAFMANKRDFEYHDETGEPRRFEWSEDPVQANMTNARMAHRMIESGEMPFTELVQDGAKPLDLAVMDDDELSRYADIARAQGLVNAQGFLIDPSDPEVDFIEGAAQGRPGMLGSAESQGTMRYDVRKRTFDKIRELAQERGIDITHIDPTGIKRGGQGSEWFAGIGQQVEVPEAPDPGGLGGIAMDISNTLDVAQTAVGRDSIATAGPNEGGITGAIGQIAGPTYDQFVRGSRTANMALNLPAQEITGLVRNIYDAATGGRPEWWETQSDLGISLEANLRGETLNAGSGFTVDADSEIHRERLAREAERGMIDGHRISLGRIVASATPYEPGDRPYDILSGLVDFGQAIFLDPANIALGGGAKAGRARSLFSAAEDLTAEGLEQAGGISSLLNLVDSPTAQSWLDGPGGSRVVAALRDETSPAAIARNSPDMPMDLIPQLADAATDAEVRGLLFPQLGTTFRSTKDVWTGPLSNAVREHTPAFVARWNTLIPERTFDWTNKRQMFDTLDQWGKTVRANPEMMDQHLDYILRAETRDEVWTGIRGVMTETDGVLDAAGITNPEFRNGLVQQFESQAEAAKLWYDDEIANPVPVWDNVVLDDDVMRVGTAEIGEQSPHLAALSMDTQITLPDIDAIRRMTANPALRMITTKHSIFNKELMKGEMRTPLLLTRWASEEIWKPVTLMRLAWTLRVIGEEQLRMAASPMIDSMFNHPLSYLAYRIGAGKEDLLGNPLDAAESFRAAMSSHRGGVLDDYPWRVRSEQSRKVFNRDDADFGYVDGWGTELVKLHQDPITNHLVNSDIDETIRWLNGEAAPPVTPRSTIEANRTPGMTLEDAHRSMQRRSTADYGMAHDEDTQGLLAAGNTALDDMRGGVPGNRNVRNVERVRLSDTVTSEPNVNPEYLGQLVDNPLAHGDHADYIPIAVRTPDGKVRIIDGRHRAIAAAADDGTFKARIKDVDWDGNELPHGTNRTATPIEPTAGTPYRDRLATVTGIDMSKEGLLRAYLQSAERRIQYMSTGDNELLDAIRTGTFRGKNLTKKNGLFKDRDFVNALSDIRTTGPERVVGVITPDDTNDVWSQLGKRWRTEVVDNMFGFLMTDRTNNLSRSPFFVQSYWERIRELTPYISDRDTLRARFEELPELMRNHGIDKAEGVQGILGRRFQKRFDYQLDKVADDPASMITMEQADMLAKDYALQSVRKTLFDVSKKTNWEASMGVLSPFISAWKEVLTAWGGIAAKNPRVIRRGFQGLNAATNSGIFYTDETTGELMFTYPGSQFVSEKLTGVPIPLSGRASGLNFMSQVLPGIGPALQVPVTFFMAGKPEYQEWYERLVPFGSPAEEGPGEAANIWNYAPPWMKRFFQGVTEGNFLTSKQDHRTYMNTVMHVSQYLMSTGEYDSASPADMQRLIEDARDKAKIFYLIRAGASFTAPSAPSPQWLIETDTPDGLIETAVLTEEYRRAQNGEIPNVDFENAHEYMLDKYGDEIVLALTPFSRTISWGLDPSTEFHEWSQQHPSLSDDYPSIFGLFGPTGDFEIGVFSSQFRGDEAMRSALTPEQWATFSQHLIAQRQYDKARTQVGADRNTPEGRDYMRDVTEYLRDHYPGWRNFRGLPGGVEDDTAMHELRGIINEPGVADTELADAVRYYLDQRDAIVEDLWEEDQITLGAQASQYERDFLNELGTALMERTPTFERVFSMVLSRELEGPATDPEEEEGSNGQLPR